MIVFRPAHWVASQARSARQLRICFGMGETACTEMMVGPSPLSGRAMTVGRTRVLPAVRSTLYAPSALLTRSVVERDFDT